jgi:hypothetical protein
MSFWLILFLVSLLSFEVETNMELLFIMLRLEAGSIVLINLNFYDLKAVSNLFLNISFHDISNFKTIAHLQITPVLQIQL